MNSTFVTCEELWRSRRCYLPLPITPSSISPPVGSKGGALVRALASHQCGLGSNPGVDAICGSSLLLVLSLALRGFSLWVLRFPLSSKTYISKFQFNQVSGRRRTTLWMCYLQIVIYLLIYLYLHNYS